MSRPRPNMNAAEHRHRRSGDGMLDIMLHEMEGLSPGEKRGPIDAAKAAAARELAHAAGMAEPSMPGASPASRFASPAARTAPETGSDRGRPGDGALEEAARGIGPGTWAAAGARQGCRRVLPAPGIAEHAATRTDLQEYGKKTEASSFRKTPPGQCSCLVSFIRSRSLRRSSS